MTFIGILMAVVFALIVGALFYNVFKISGPWGTFWSFLVVLVLVGIAAHVWINPVGPVAWGIAWIPPLFVTIVFALLLAAASPPKPKETGNEPSEKDQKVAALGGFFWILLIFLFGIILWGVIGNHTL